ncbi:DUF202 domain-containing protein [Janibacter sp. G56]|uniref:DUF202 domain-containing protein n=1 Tax=Janibacter sp. G56 TaxID=3418717 RepID=UPI003CFC8ABD
MFPRRRRRAVGVPRTVPLPARDNLQPERTALAWQRTGVSTLVLPLPLLAIALHHERWTAVAGLAVVTIAAAFAVGGVRFRFAELLDDDTHHSPYGLMTTIATVAGGAGAVGATFGIVLAALR